MSVTESAGIEAGVPMAEQEEFAQEATGHGHGGITETAGDSPQREENSALAPKGETAVVAQADNILTRLQRAFIAANPEFEGMDFVNFGEWVTLNKLGQFMYFDDEQMVNPDKPTELAVILAGGKRAYQLWAKIGKKEEGGDPERNGLLVFGATREEAEAKFFERAAVDHGFSEMYDVDDIKLRFMIILVPADSDPEFPTIWLINFPETGALAFGKYSSKLFTGRYMQKFGIKKGTKIAEVLTRIFVTSEKNRRDPSITYAALNFEPLGYAPFSAANDAAGEETAE